MTEVRISHIARLGDGVFLEDKREHHVGLTLPGELVKVDRAEKNYRLSKILEPSSDRLKPVCAHFGECGGCQMQHAGNKVYNVWKKMQKTKYLWH